MRAFVVVVALVGGGAMAQDGARGVSVRLSGGQVLKLYGESHALLIGVSRYTAGWQSLESVPGELDRVEKALKRQGFQVEQSRDPGAKALRDAVESFINRWGYKPENRLLFFFSGHGHTRKDGRKGYIVPADAPSPEEDEEGFLAKAVEMEQVNTWARRIEAKHALFLFDSCFSGTVFKAKDTPVPKAVSRATANPVRQFITAGSAGEPVPARSVFVPAFIRAIEGDADRFGDGYVTGTALGLYLQRKVAEYQTGQTPQFGKIRDPELDEGDFVFVVPGPEKPVPTEEAGGESKATREKEYWKEVSLSGSEEAYEKYLEKVRKGELPGKYRKLAEEKLAELREGQEPEVTTGSPNPRTDLSVEVRALKVAARYSHQTEGVLAATVTELVYALPAEFPCPRYLHVAVSELSGEGSGGRRSFSAAALSDSKARGSVDQLISLMSFSITGRAAESFLNERNKVISLELTGVDGDLESLSLRVRDVTRTGAFD